MKQPNTTRRRTSRRKKAVKLIPFDAARYLRSDEAIAEYLNEALRVQDPRFLLRALGDGADEDAVRATLPDPAAFATD